MYQPYYEDYRRTPPPQYYPAYEYDDYPRYQPSQAPLYDHFYQPHDYSRNFDQQMINDPPPYRFEPLQPLVPIKYKEQPTINFDQPKAQPIRSIHQEPPPFQYYQEGDMKSRFNHNVYSDETANQTQEDDYPFAEKQINWNDPSNMPYQPVLSNGNLFELDLEEFLRNLPKYTPHKEEIEFVTYLASTMLVERKLNVIQRELNSDSKFNSRMLFDFFDERKSNSIDFSEFKFGLNKLDIYFKNDECFSLFCRAASKDRLISNSEFHELLIGQINAQISFIQHGAYSYMHQIETSKKQQYLTVQQRELISESLMLQMQMERNLLYLREQIGSDEILIAIFRQIDKGLKGYLVINDFLPYLKELGGFFFTVDDLQQTFRRISGQRGGRVNLTEFYREFHIQQTEEMKKNLEYDCEDKNKRQFDFIDQIKKQKEEQQKIQAEKLKAQQEQSRLQAERKKEEKKESEPKIQEQHNPPSLSPSRVQRTPSEHFDVSFPGFNVYKLYPPSRRRQ